MTPTLSVVVPMHNEADALGPLVAEIVAATGQLPLSDIVCVDDGSTDSTGARLAALRATTPALRVFAHPRRSGQSAGIVTGVRAARGDLVVTLDGDGQNDPADIPALYAAYVSAMAARKGSEVAGGPVLVAGQRRVRQDDLIRRLSSRLANALRGWILRDGVTDTGCGLKLFARQDFLRYPAFNHMHRYLPALTIRAGGAVVLVPVHHRPRTRGVSKYGVWDRLRVGIADLAGVWWLSRRPVDVRDVRELGEDTASPATQASSQESAHAAVA